MTNEFDQRDRRVHELVRRALLPVRWFHVMLMRERKLDICFSPLGGDELTEGEGGGMSERMTEETAAALAVWAESDDVGDLTADDPRVERGTSAGHEKARRMLKDAAAGDPEAEELLARINLGGRPSLGGVGTSRR